MLTPATYVTVLCVLFIYWFYHLTFVILKDQIAAHKSGIITTTCGICDKGTSPGKYYSIIAVRIFLIVVLGPIAFASAALLNQESHQNLINSHIFALSAILAPVVGLWIFRFREPFRSFIKDVASTTWNVIASSYKAIRYFLDSSFLRSAALP